YLREKQTLLEQTHQQDELFAIGERQKLEYELRSIQRIVKQMYELREKKIIDIALNRSKTGSDIIDTSAMVMEEKEFYEHVLRTLDTYRRGILISLLKCELPNVQQQRIPLAPLTLELRQEKPVAPGKMHIKLLQAVPQFIWTDMKEYGPFAPGETIEIYKEIAELLVRKGRAVKE
ncbi:MAG: hypothetical protein Q7K45_03920, partial [Nanoarchaeota archaeon]|nr:hypothetical protein [Nanoarchaeota archaeon]